MGKILPFLCAIMVSACDLRQHIAEAPNNISDFIAAKYPALLADPGSEIYEYASVLDYGNDNGASLYGDPLTRIAYASASDYDQSKIIAQTISDTTTDYGTLVVAEKKSFVLNTLEIKVEKGDTAYSLAKKYGMPVGRLAALNDLGEPYTLSIGQTLRVEVAEIVTTKTEIPKTDASAAQAAAAKSTAPSPKLERRSSGKFSWPVRGNIISDFGPKRGGLMNDGINIGAPRGTAVGAADNGAVAYAGNELKGMGNLLIIQHSGGWMTVYAHLDDFIVKRGDKVAVGQKIGTVGMTGKVSDPQLHFEIRKGSKALDPKKELK
ncbi:MAG: peptidoglycan DD-metalloendopeptidase family protein [Rickettsiales bacterium]|jgi:LysM repeat protein|nr:peptidoglycan DD-metalloendopeptidase family protein [Rickettsiales bacterium]